MNPPLTDKLELLKSNTIQFEIDLDKRRFSESLIIEIIKADSALSQEQILKSEVNDKEQLKVLKQFIDNRIKGLNKILYQECIDEYREINDDFKFRNTKEGQLILQIESWVTKMRKLIDNLKMNNVYLGRSFIDPKELIIGGILENIYSKLKNISFFEENQPPVKPKYQFEIL